jgi:hypothetical protein
MHRRSNHARVGAGADYRGGCRCARYADEVAPDGDECAPYSYGESSGYSDGQHDPRADGNDVTCHTGRNDATCDFDRDCTGKPDAHRERDRGGERNTPDSRAFIGARRGRALAAAHR